MFDYEKCIRKLNDFGKLSKSKQQNLIEDMLTNRTFAEFLFKEKLTDPQGTMEKFYTALVRPSVLKALVNYVEDEGYDEFNRTHATFFYSICSVALDVNNDREQERVKKRRDGQISNREFQELGDKIEQYTKLVNRLFKACKKIVKSEAEELAEDANLPTYITKMALYNVPSPSMIARERIGKFLNILMAEIYEKVQEKQYSVSGVDWKVFFKELFGKDNLAEVATFLLLEKHSRLTKFNDEYVNECWESLTEFALTQINNAPEQLRDKMVELYLKRIDSMFRNGKFELRVDLSSIPKLGSYPKLAETIDKYIDRLEAILK